MEENKYPLIEAKAIAEQVMAELSPFCDRIIIAGSIRREKDFVKDIEICAIAKPYQTGLFEDGIASVVNQWTKVKGEMEYGKTKYTQRILPSGIKLDLFFATEKNWGLILAIRTGSADYSHKVLTTKWVQKGYKSIDGNLILNGGRAAQVREEQDLFKLLGIQYVEPKYRNL